MAEALTAAEFARRLAAVESLQPEAARARASLPPYDPHSIEQPKRPIISLGKGLWKYLLPFELIQANPTGAVLKASAYVEEAVKSAARELLPADERAGSASELMYQLDRVPGIDAACMGMFGELRSLRDGVARAPDFALSPDLAFRYTRVAIYLIRALAQFQAARRERSDCQTDHVAIGPYRIPTIQVGDSKIRRESQWYNIGFLITFGIAFVSSWIYCIATNGLLVGAGVGFLPCLILAGIAGALWPLVAFVVFLAIVFALKL